MTATFAANLAWVVLSVCGAALLTAIGVQLDFGEPEYAGPALYCNTMARHEQEQRGVRAAIAAHREARHGRHEDDEEWRFNTIDWDTSFVAWLRAVAEEPVARSSFGTPEMADEWIEAVA